MRGSHRMVSRQSSGRGAMLVGLEILRLADSEHDRVATQMAEVNS